MTSHNTRKDFWCSIKSKTQLVKVLSQYLKEDGTQLPTSKMMLTHALVGLLRSSNVSKMLLCLQKAHAYLYYFALTEKGDGGNLHESRHEVA